MQKQVTFIESLHAENIALRQQNVQASQNEAKSKRANRPVIEGNLNDSEWALFLDTWQRYKTMASLTQPDEIRMELRAACSSDVNKLLFEFVGPTILNSATEAQLLNHIKGVAVKGLHKEVHRVNFGKITQSDGESITHFVARLNAQAALCSFTITCSCEAKVSFAEDMVAQQLVAGLRDQEHQAKVLSEATTLTTLQSKITRLQSLETTEESATKLHIPGRASAGKSGYKQAGKKKFVDTNKPPEKKKVCSTCGRMDYYGRSMSFQDCPASQRGKKCNICGKEGHFSSVCKQKQSKASAGQNDADEYEPEDTTEASTSFFFATRSVEDFPHSPMST